MPVRDRPKLVFHPIEDERSGVRTLNASSGARRTRFSPRRSDALGLVMDKFDQGASQRLDRPVAGPLFEVSAIDHGLRRACDSPVRLNCATQCGERSPCAARLVIDERLGHPRHDVGCESDEPNARATPFDHHRRWEQRFTDHDRDGLFHVGCKVREVWRADISDSLPEAGCWIGGLLSTVSRCFL